MSLTVVEVLERSSQGRTEPYLCRCDDDELYFVKGHSATRPGLIAEWLCARLGEAFGLPIPPYAIVTVPEELIAGDFLGQLNGLGVGEVFASRKVPGADFTEVHRRLVPRALRYDLLAFDWWVHNGDRNLTACGGNPNLLWNPAGNGALVVIDHNLAFDAAFSAQAFVELHVFAEDIPAMFSDFVLRQDYARRVRVALGIWGEICDTVPSSWHFIDPEQTLPLDFPFASVKALLEHAQTDAFWNLPT
jgi:hypothetical protein